MVGKALCPCACRGSQCGLTFVPSVCVDLCLFPCVGYVFACFSWPASVPCIMSHAHVILHFLQFVYRLTYSINIFVEMHSNFSVALSLCVDVCVCLRVPFSCPRVQRARAERLIPRTAYSLPIQSASSDMNLQSRGRGRQ
jgi:hypothetical protein